jgi:hypothetical protein
MHARTQLWRGMADEGLITQEEYLDTAFAQFYRTKEEFVEPLNDPSSLVAHLQLRVDACTTDVVRCPYRQSYDDGLVPSWCAQMASHTLTDNPLAQESTTRWPSRTRSSGRYDRGARASSWPA